MPCDQRHFTHIIPVYIMSLTTSWMITLLTTHKILNKRRIRGLVYRTWTSVIFIGPGLLGFLGRGLGVYNVFASKLLGRGMKKEKHYPSLPELIVLSERSATKNYIFLQPQVLLAAVVKLLMLTYINLWLWGFSDSISPKDLVLCSP